MDKRHSIAIDLQQSRDIPAISKSLLFCIDECAIAGVDPAADPAIRLIVHRLVFLTSCIN